MIIKSSFTYLIRVISIYFIFLRLLWKLLFLWYFLSLLVFGIQKVYWLVKHLNVNLYSPTLIKEFIRCNNSLMELVGSFVYKLKSFVLKYTMLHSFKFLSPCSSCLITLAMMSSTMLNQYGESGHHFFFLILKEIVWASQHWGWW